MKILIILMLILCISASSLGYGFYFKNNSKLIYQFAIGHVIILGLFFLFSVFAIILRFHIYYYIILFSAITFLGLCLLVKYKSFIGKTSICELFFLLVFVAIILFVGYTKAFAFEYGDSLWYMSIVNNTQSADLIGYVNYGNGHISDVVNKTYDFSTYYHFWGIFLRILNILLLSIIGNSEINIYVFVIISHILSLISAYGLFIQLISAFKEKSKLNIILLFVFVLVYLHTPYYVTTHVIFGGNWRDIIIAIIMYELFQLFTSNEKNKNNLLLALLLMGNLSVSSSALFINIAIIYIYILSLLSRDCERNYTSIFITVSLPISIFATAYLGLWVMVFSVVFYVLIFIYMISPFDMKRLFNKIIKIILFIFPFLLLLISIIGIGFIGDTEIYPYFFNHSSYDHTFDIFTFNTFPNIVFNVFYWGTMIYYLVCGNNKYIKGIFIIFFFFYNPLTYKGIYLIMSGLVHFRLTKIILNIFTLYLLFGYFLGNVRLNKIAKYTILILGIIVCTMNFSFNLSTTVAKSKEYNFFTKIDDEKLEVYNFIHGDINYRGLERPLILSQAFDINAYIPNTKYAINNFNAIIIPEYAENYPVNDDLIKMFYPNKYNEKLPFKYQNSNYDGMCKVITDIDPTYTLIDKSHFFREGDEYRYIYSIVDDCEHVVEVYDNEDYKVYVKSEIYE